MRTAKETTQGKSTVLIGFIALSFLAHGLLFLFQTNSQNQLTHASLGNSKLSISLVNADTKIKNNTTTQEKLTNKKPLQKATQEIVEKITIVTKPVQTMVTAHNYASTTIKKSKQQTTPDVRQRNFLLGEIQHRLSRYLSYPARARRRGWQGDVMVGFHIDKRGFLHNVHLTQTSGYSLLDNAALTAIEKVKNIPLSSWFKHNRENTFHPTALQLPVSYRLTNS